VNISPKIPGRIKQFLVDEGDDVKTGQTIAILESDDIDAKVAQATGQYEAVTDQASEAKVASDLQALASEDQLSQALAGQKAAAAKLALALAGARSQEKEQAKAAYDAAKEKLDEALRGARPQEIEQAQNGVDQATAVYNAAKATYERFKNLYQEGVIPRQKQDEIEMQYLSAKAGKEAAEAKLSLVKEGPRKEDIQQARDGMYAAKAQLSLAMEGARKEDIEQARAGLDAAKATVQLAKHNLMQVQIRDLEAKAATNNAKAVKGKVTEAQVAKREMKLVAPVSGYISQKISNAGEIVSAGFPIASIVKRDDFKVKVYADESKFGYLKLHSPIRIVIPALANKTCGGELARIAQAADFATHKATNEQGSVDVRSVELVVRIPNPPDGLRDGMTARVQLGSDAPRN
jgi:HlyD family secretion protein